MFFNENFTLVLLNKGVSVVGQRPNKYAISRAYSSRHNIPFGQFENVVYVRIVLILIRLQC
jgi:hypothetical protein